MTLKRLMLLGIALLSLSACDLSMNAKTSDFCLLYNPITSSSKDTEKTRSQIDNDNAVYDVVCPDDKR